MFYIYNICKFLPIKRNLVIFRFFRPRIGDVIAQQTSLYKKIKMHRYNCVIKKGMSKGNRGYASWSRVTAPQSFQGTNKEYFDINHPYFKPKYTPEEVKKNPRRLKESELAAATTSTVRENHDHITTPVYFENDKYVNKEQKITSHWVPNDLPFYEKESVPTTLNDQLNEFIIKKNNNE